MFIYLFSPKISLIIMPNQKHVLYQSFSVGPVYFRPTWHTFSMIYLPFSPQKLGGYQLRDASDCRCRLTFVWPAI